MRTSAVDHEIILTLALESSKLLARRETMLSVRDVFVSLRASPRVARLLRTELAIPWRRKQKINYRGFQLGYIVRNKSRMYTI